MIKTDTQRRDVSLEKTYQFSHCLVEGSAKKGLVFNDTVIVHWIGDSEALWYQRLKKIPGGIVKEFRVVNSKKQTNIVAFDHSNLAVSLAEVSGQPVHVADLPFDLIQPTLDADNVHPLCISFTAFGQVWQFDIQEQTCSVVNKTPISPFVESISPTGEWLIFVRNYNLWLRDLCSGVEKSLTVDGKIDFSYGAANTSWGIPLPHNLDVLWSSDAKRILAIQRDIRSVKSIPWVDHLAGNSCARPKLKEAKVAHPGDTGVEEVRLFAINIASGAVCAADYPAMPTAANQLGWYFEDVAWWGSNNRHAYFIDTVRGDKCLRVVSFDTDTGSTQVLFEETSSNDTQVNLSNSHDSLPLHRYLPNTNELIWWSEGSGYGHLYLYDLNTGAVKHAITEGDWVVRSIAYVDEGRRELIIQTSGRIAGRDPYYQDICRLHIDTGELTPLLSVDTEVTLHHRRSFSLWGDGLQGKVSNTTGGVSPTGDFIVATCSRVDQAPVTVLLDREGNRLMEIEAADTRALSGNWTWPEPVQAKATDGETDLYGVLHRPSGFSAGQSYPVINYINSGPWISVVPKASFSSAGVYADRHYFYAQALAELGFVVLCLDSRGTPLRSKAFQDESYGWIPSAANTDDHVGAIKQLAEIYPEMDLDRVGIVCQFYRSGIQNFLERQDFYKVCVQMALHDSRMNPGCIEGEKYEGVNGPENNKPYAEDLAKNLEGKLLLMNVLNAGSSAVYPSAAAFRVVDALQKANKNFDMLFLPQAGGSVCNYYMFRRAWDYLLKHLAGVEPPKEVNLGEGGL